MVETERKPNELFEPKIPINYIGLFEDFIRVKHPEYAKDLLKQVYDGVSCPIVRFDLKDLSDENLIAKFRKEPEEFLLECCDALKNVVMFEDPTVKDLLSRIHIIPDCKGAEWLIPLQEKLIKDLTRDREKIFRFKVRFMSLSLERRIEFERLMWLCSSCGTEFETIPLRKTTENFRKPSFCVNKKCKAKNKSDFMLLSKKSTSFEKRTFTVIDVENQESINEIECYISININYFEEKCKNIHCNDEIEVLGILKMDTADIDSSIKAVQLPLYYIEVIDINSENMNNVNPKIVEQIKREIKKDQLFCNKLIDSIHPYSQNIINFFPIKLLYTTSFITSDSYDKIRNGINSIVAGHSGTQKSKIAIEFKEKLSASNFGIIYGKNTTAKGLVPVAQRNSNEKNLIKRYGAIPYYNKKTFLIDEAHYMYAKDPDALECFKCFEDGTISRALDGTTINAPAKGTVILALNYKTEDEAYDFDKSLEGNLNFPEDQKSVLDRFDLHYRIPRNTTGIVKVLEKRDSPTFVPKFNISDEIIFNYLIEAKRLYSAGILIPKGITKIIEQLYDAILEKKKSNVALNPREPRIIKKVLRVIAAMRLRSEVIEDDVEYLKKYLINTIIPFQDNSYVIQARTIDIDEVFKNTFDLLVELYENKFSISEFIEFLIDYLKENYFPTNFKDRDLDLPNLEKYISTDKNRYNLTNNKFKELLDKHLEFIEKMGFIVEKFNNKTHFLKKEFAYDLIKKDLEEIFEDNETDVLDVKDTVKVLEQNTSFSIEFITTTIYEMIKNRDLKKEKNDKIKFVK